MFWAGFVTAQTFNKTFLDQNEPFYFQTITHVDSIIITAGFGIDSLNPNKPKYLWKQLGLNGGVLQEFEYIDTLNGLNGTQNGLFVADSSIYHCLFSSGNGYFSRPLVLKTSFAGKVIDLKYYSKVNRTVHSPLGFFVSSSNDIYIYGLHQPFGNESNAMVIKIDKDLNQIWFKDYGVSNKTETAHSITELSNGNLLIGAHRTDAGMTVAGQRYQEQTWIFEIDTAGNMVREFLDTNTRTGPAKGLTETQDGGFVFCGKKQVFWNGHLTHLYENSLTKIDKNLNNIIWEKTFADTISNVIGLNNIAYNHQGEIIAFGTQPVRFGFTFGYDFSGLIVNYDQNGNKNWERNFRNEDSLNLLADNVFFGGTINNKGELFFAGRSELRNGGPTKGWILKLDSNGCYDNGFCGYPIVSVK